MSRPLDEERLFSLYQIEEIQDLLDPDGIRQDDRRDSNWEEIFSYESDRDSEEDYLSEFFIIPE